MSTLQIEFWQFLAGLFALLGFFGLALTGLGRMLLNQINLRLAERFEDLKQTAGAQLGKLEQETRDLERNLLQLRAELPVQYVRREDAIREQVAIHAKLDALALRIENLVLRSKP